MRDSTKMHNPLITLASNAPYDSGEISVGAVGCKRPIGTKAVNWGTGKEPVADVLTVECLANAPEGKAAIWYEGKELSSMRKKEIHRVKQAQFMAGNGNSIESDDMTWRGFEDIKGCWCRVEKSADYTTAVVKHYHSQVNSGYTDMEELKRIAKGLSKQERTRARNLALLDAKEVGMSSKRNTIRKSKSNVTPSTTTSSSLKGGLKKSLSSDGASKSASGSTLRMKVKNVRRSVSNMTNFGGTKGSSTPKRLAYVSC